MTPDEVRQLLIDTFSVMETPSREEVVTALAALRHLTPEELAPLVRELTEGEPQYGEVIIKTDNILVIVGRWGAKAECPPHNHGDMDGAVLPLGAFFNQSYKEVGDGDIQRTSARIFPRGMIIPVFREIREGDGMN